jgi:hypothetical protein
MKQSPRKEDEFRIKMHGDVSVLFVDPTAGRAISLDPPDQPKIGADQKPTTARVKKTKKACGINYSTSSLGPDA